MVQMKEFRIVMPISVEEFQIAQMYMVMKMQQQNTTGEEGVEVLENQSFEDDVYGKGQYTSKIYRLQSKAPTWLAKFAPAGSLVMQEEAWNAYPRCKSGLFYFPLCSHYYLKFVLMWPFFRLIVSTVLHPLIQLSSAHISQDLFLRLKPFTRMIAVYLKMFMGSPKIN